MDSVLAQLGIGASGPGSEERLRGMADTIRGDQKLGQFYQASGNQDVRNAGRGLIDKADTTISNVANARQKGLTRTRQAMMDERDANQTAYDRNRDTEMDLLAADDTAYTRGRDTMTDELDAAALEYERSGWTDIEERADSEGNVALYGLKDGRGALQKIPDSDGLKETDPYAGRGKGTGKGMRVKLPGTDAVIWKNVDGSIVGPKGDSLPRKLRTTVRWRKVPKHSPRHCKQVMVKKSLNSVPTPRSKMPLMVPACRICTVFFPR